MLVERARDVARRCRHLPGLLFLLKLVRFDNPEMKVRTGVWRMHTPWPTASQSNCCIGSSERIDSTDIILLAADSSAHPNETFNIAQHVNMEGSDHDAALPTYAALAQDLEGASNLSHYEP